MPRTPAVARSVPALALLAACAALLLGVGAAGPKAASVGADLVDGVPLAGAISSTDWRPDAPTEAAAADIPPEYLELYIHFGAQMGVDWRFLAAIGGQESDHGRHPAVDRVNRAGCVGPMQLGTGGRCGDFVGEFGRDGDGDGQVDPLVPADAIASAAFGLRAGKGTPPPGGSFEEHRRSACRYYGACASPGVDYADEVMERAVSYGFPPES
jgi:hypothetical protein